MIRAQILLTPTLTEELKIVASEKNKSFSAVVREMLEKGLAKQRKKQNAGDFLLKLAKNAVTGGPKDLSTNDDYLYQI